MTSLMPRAFIRALSLVALVAMAGLSFSASAFDGRVLVVRGTAHVERGAQRLPVQKHMGLREGDTIVTSANGNVKWIMNDDSMYALGRLSAFKITEFKVYRARDDQAASGAFGRMTLDLLRGGFRSISGWIGTRNKSSYSVRTPVATMGIRGTDYVYLFITQAMSTELGIPPGIYVRVRTGAVALTTTPGGQGGGSSQNQAQGGQRGNTPDLIVNAGQTAAIGFTQNATGGFSSVTPPRMVGGAGSSSADAGLANKLNAAFAAGLGVEGELSFDSEFFDELADDIIIEPENPDSPS